jgi:hypothetical protein
MKGSIVNLTIDSMCGFVYGFREEEEEEEEEEGGTILLVFNKE